MYGKKKIMLDKISSPRQKRNLLDKESLSTKYETFMNVLKRDIKILPTVIASKDQNPEELKNAEITYNNNSKTFIQLRRGRKKDDTLNVIVIEILNLKTEELKRLAKYFGSLSSESAKALIPKVSLALFGEISYELERQASLYRNHL